MKRTTASMFVVLAVSFMVGCGSSSSSPTPTTITLTGTIGTGAIPNITKAATPAAGYMVVAINNSTNETYHTTTNSAGSFSLELPANIEFHLSLMNDGSYVGPTVFDGSATEVNTVIKPTANLSLGAITVNTTDGYAMTDTPPSAVVDSITAIATDGVPYGAGPDNDGKNTLADVVNRDDMDMDKDGIPNLFDADEDNDGFRNGIKSVSTGVIGGSTVVDQVFMGSNIWVPHGEVPAGTTHAEYAPDHIALRIIVTPKSGKEDTISAVQCISVPASIEDIATINTGSVGDAINYPPENSNWEEYSYNLYKMTTELPGSWIINITPHIVMNIGDTFTIRATYTDDTYEDFFLTTSYVLTDWAWISTYGGQPLPDDEGTRTVAAEFETDTLTIVFNKPLDEAGVPLEGLTYTVSYGVSTWSGEQWNVPTSRVTIPGDEVTDNGDGTLSATIPGDGDDPLVAGETYYVVPIAESADGQRNGEETWFTFNPK